MAIIDGLKNIAGNSINVPVLGAISVPVAIIGGMALYFLVFRRKGRITSVTTRYRK
jgi:hypothetical protein